MNYWQKVKSQIKVANESIFYISQTVGWCFAILFFLDRTPSSSAFGLMHLCFWLVVTHIVIIVGMFLTEMIVGLRRKKESD